MNEMSKNQNQELENKFRGGVKSNPENSLNITREKDWYKEKIIEMVNQIESEDYIISIYSFTKVFFED